MQRAGFGKQYAGIEKPILNPDVPAVYSFIYLNYITYLDYAAYDYIFIVNA